MICGTEVGMIVGVALVKFEEPETGIVAVELIWLLVELDTLVTKEPPLGITLVEFD